MKFAAPLLTAGAMAQNYQLPQQSFTSSVVAPAKPAAPAMDPMMMMLLMGDNNSDMKKLLPLMMMGGSGGMGGMDPMMMMLMLDDSSSSSSSSSMSDLLPLMMMGGGMGGMGGANGAQGGMNPLMMMTLLDESCTFKTAVKSLTTTDANKKALALGEKFSTDKGVTLTTTVDGTYVDYDYIKCSKGKSSGLSDMLPLMMMGGNGGMGGMDPMMMMLMMGDSSSGLSDMLPLMMMNQQPTVDPVTGVASAPAMNPLMMMTLLDEPAKTKVACDEKFKLPYAFKGDKTKLTTAATIRAAVLGTGTSGILGASSTWATDYKKCLTAATSEGTASTSSSLDKLLPLMMMGGMGGSNAAGGMDPMMMMLMLKD
jgi:hypothetical protein